MDILFLVSFLQILAKLGPELCFQAGKLWRGLHHQSFVWVLDLVFGCWKKEKMLLYSLEEHLMK